MPSALPLRELEDAEVAYQRVKAELEALTQDDLAPLNVDIVSAASIALGVAERIVEHRDRMAKLPEFEIRHVDNLVDYAKATWYAYATNLPSVSPQELQQYLTEVAALRSKFLTWATALATEGKFEEVAIAKIKEGSGHRHCQRSCRVGRLVPRKVGRGEEHVCRDRGGAHARGFDRACCILDGESTRLSNLNGTVRWLTSSAPRLDTARSSVQQLPPRIIVPPLRRGRRGHPRTQSSSQRGNPYNPERATSSCARPDYAR